MLGLKDFNEAYMKASKQLYIDMVKANRIGELDAYMENIDSSLKIKNGKILVFGYSQVAKETIYEVCNDYGYSKNDIDIAIDQKSIKGFDCNSIVSGKYSVVIIGQIPHKLRNFDCKNSGLIGEIVANPNKYENTYIAKNKSRIRITKDALENILENHMQIQYCC